MLFVRPVHIPQVLWNALVQNHTAHRRINRLGNRFAVKRARAAHFHLRLQGHIAQLIRHNRFIFVRKDRAFALCVRLNQRQIIHAHNHVLRRGNNRFPVLGFQHVVYRQHQKSCFRLCFHRQRNMHGHLVAVKVRVVGRTHQRVNLQRAAFHQHRLKSLNAQSVQRGGAVQKHRMFFDDIFQHIPYPAVGTFHQLFRLTHVVAVVFLYQLFQYKRLKQFQRHFLRQPALIHPQFRANHDYATAGIVNTFAQQVLAETALFASQQIGQRFQRPVARARHRPSSAAVVDQSVYCLLQHAFFIAHNDVRRFEFQ